MEKKYYKLVRDKIPEIIVSNNEVAETRILSDDEYKSELEVKLLEESSEVIKAKTPSERLEELADLLEVMKAIAKIENLTLEDIEEKAKQKALKKGAFDKKIFLIKTDTRD